LGSTWIIDADPPVPSTALDQLWRVHWNASLRPWSDTSALVVQIKNNLEATYKTRIHRIVLEKTSYQIQAYPHRDVKACQTAIACLWRDDAGLTGLAAKQGFDAARGQQFVEITPFGLNEPNFRFGYHARHVEPWQPLEVERSGNRFYFNKIPGHHSLSIRVRDSSAGTEDFVFAVN
jgi:hypothetical protein